MLVRLQFIVSLGDAGTALAWPADNKPLGLRLTYEPLSSIGYGSEAVAIADLDRWLSLFPCITAAETVVLGLEH
jgi:hypothetical protein